MPRYLKYTLDQYVESDYTIVYFHYGLNSRNKPSLRWLQTTYKEFDRKYVPWALRRTSGWGRSEGVPGRHEESQLCRGKGRTAGARQGGPVSKAGGRGVTSFPGQQLCPVLSPRLGTCVLRGLDSQYLSFTGRQVLVTTAPP